MGPTQHSVYLEPALFLWDKSGSGLNLTAHPPPILELRNEWSYTAAPQYVFMTWTRKTSAFPIYNPYTINTNCSVVAIEWLG